MGTPQYSANNALAVRAYVATGNTSLSNYALVLNKLKDLQAPDGSWDESINATSHAVWALIEAGETPDSIIIKSAIAWIKAQQNTDGGWGIESDTNSTSKAIIAGGFNSQA